MEIKAALQLTLTEEEVRVAIEQYIQANLPEHYSGVLVVNDITFLNKRKPTRIEVEISACIDDGSTANVVKNTPRVSQELLDSVDDDEAEEADDELDALIADTEDTSDDHAKTEMDLIDEVLAEEAEEKSPKPADDSLSKLLEL